VGLHWRVMGELEELGETLVFHDPSVLREYMKWCRKKSLTLCPGFKTNLFLLPQLLDHLEKI